MSGKLGNDNHRLLGTRNSSGPSPKFLEPFLSVSSPPRGFSLRRRPIAYQLRDSIHAGKGSNSHSSLHSGESRVHQLTLFGPPKRKWSEASGEPDTPEPVPSLRTLQNGRNPHGKGPTKKRRFYGQDRSEGRIFHSSPLSGRSEIYKIHVGRHLYEFACLPFGLSSAPRVFTKTMKPVVALLRQLGLRMIIYLDDLLIMAQSQDLLNCHVSTVRNLLENLGFIISYLKSVLIPATQMEFLGFLIDSQTMTLALPRDKVRKVKKECQSVLNYPQVTVRELAKLIGHLTSTIQAVFPGPLHFRHLQGDKNKSLAQFGSYDSLIQLSPYALEELVLWRDNLDAWNGMSLISGTPNLMIEIDASRKGWGTFCMGVSTGGQWSQGESKLHINCLELLAGAFAIMTFGKSNAQMKVRLLMDNVTAAHYINRMGGGGDQVSSPSPSSYRPVGMVSAPQDSHRGTVPSGSFECTRRQRVQSHERSTRLEVRPFGVYRTQSPLGASGRGSLCVPSVSSTSSLIQLEARPTSGSCGCFFPRLELNKGICIPPFCPYRKMPQKGPRSAGSLSSTSDTGLVNSVMVPSTAGDVCCPSIPPSSVSRPVNASGEITSSVEPPAGRLATIRQSYTEAGISGQTQNLLVAAWRKGTSAAYTSAWGKWDSWCRERKINPVHAPIESILEFLIAEFHAGKVFRTLNDYRSAISSTHPSIDSVRVGGHPLVVQLLKGAFNLRPPLPKYSTTWDVDVLLSFIEKIRPQRVTLP